MEPTELSTDLSSREVWARVRSAVPLVHNITNHVVMNWTANVLLAAGASPAMVHAPEEVEEFIALSRALVVNIGTLDAVFVQGMLRAAERAQARGVPWVLDPVGVGATRLRAETADALISLKPAVIRANAGEIMFLAGVHGKQSRGVDSLRGSEAAVDGARRLAERTGAVIAVTGASDFVVTPDRTIEIRGGHAMSQQVTGTGCAATALVGACLAVAPPVEACVAGLTALKRAAEAAAQTARGPGSFAVGLIDALAVWPPSPTEPTDEG